MCIDLSFISIYVKKNVYFCEGNKKKCIFAPDSIQIYQKQNDLNYKR